MSESQSIAATYVRLYADDRGESHFEDVATPLLLTDFAPPAAPLHVAPLAPATRTLWVGAQSGWGGDTPHPAPHRQIFVAVRGSYEVTASDGATRCFGPGDVLLLEDTAGKGHQTRITGESEAVVLGIVLAEDDG